jgi:hypothetical protein
VPGLLWFGSISLERFPALVQFALPPPIPS